MNLLYKKIAFGSAFFVLAAGIIALGYAGKSIDLGNTSDTTENGQGGGPAGAGAQIQAVSGSNSALFNDTFNTSGSEGGVSATESKVADAEKSFEKRNLTDRISIDLFAKYLFLKDNDQEVTPEVQQLLVDNVIEENIKKIEYITYSGAKLELISNPTIEDIRAYGNALATTIIENSPKNQGETAANELNLLAKMTDGGANPDDMAALEQLAAAYTKVAQKLVRMKIPEDAKAQQVALADNSGKVSVNVAHFSAFESDPASVISHIAAYDKNIVALGDSLRVISKYFTNKGVVYSQKEPGYAFTLLGQ